jgi:hypothetical protein
MTTDEKANRQKFQELLRLLAKERHGVTFAELNHEQATRLVGDVSAKAPKLRAAFEAFVDRGCRDDDDGGPAVVVSVDRDVERVPWAPTHAERVAAAAREYGFSESDPDPLRRSMLQTHAESAERRAEAMRFSEAVADVARRFNLDPRRDAVKIGEVLLREKHAVTRHRFVEIV